MLLICSRLSFGQALNDTLICVNNQLNGDVLLSLSPPANPCPGCTFVGYNVFYATAFGGPYTQFVPNPTITNPAAVTFTHIGANGNSNTYYYYLETVCDCAGTFVYSHTDTIDNQDPVAPSINHVTVNGSNAVIEWTPSPSPETYAYIIYYVQGGNFIIDTVYGHNNTTYTDVIAAHNPNNASCAYTIAALDRCNTLGIFNLSPQHTIHLTSSQDRCAQTVTLNWNFYTNWPGGVFKYVVYASLNGGPYQVAQTLSATDQTVTFTNVNDGDQWCYFVRAYESGGRLDSSISNVRCEKINIVQAPSYNQFETCTDASTSTVDLAWICDPAADLISFEIKHGLTPGSLNNLATVTATHPPLSVYTYSHSGVSQQQVNYYTISAIDSCNQAYLITHANTIYLSGVTTLDNISELRWTPFYMDSAMINNYMVYRNVGGAGWNLIATLSDTARTYKDDVKAFYAVQDQICYHVMANYTFHLPVLPANYNSLSNEWCASPYSTIYVPNAVFPKGNNKVFKPIIAFPEFTDYRMDIFNRWGERVFTSVDYNIGWDGTTNGKDAIEGNYTFLITFTKADGKQFVQQGNVAVVY